MPKTPTSRSPYRLALPSPTGLPPRSSFYRRPVPSTPSPPSRLQASGPLHAFAAASQDVKQEFEESIFQTPTRRSAIENDSGGLRSPFELKQEELGDAEQELFQPRANGHMRSSHDSGDLASSRRGSWMTHCSVLSAPLRTIVPSRALVKARRLRKTLKARAQAKATRRQLRQAQEEVDALKTLVERLGRSERRLKARVSKDREVIKDTRVELKEYQEGLLAAEDKIDQMGISMDELRGDFNHYRGWWLSENRSLKVVLGEIPRRKWSTGIQAIASSSHGRFMSYSGSGSN